MSIKQGKLFIVSAPTGCGKTTIVQELLKRGTVTVKLVITYTTRPQGQGEINGQHYHFITHEDFLAKKAHGFFLETTVYKGFLYGSPKSILDEIKKGASFIMVVDRPGALHLKTLVPKAISIWLTVSNPETLVTRLTKRGRETGDILAGRIALAQEEFASELDQKNFTYYVLNDDMRLALQSLETIMLNETRSS